MKKIIENIANWLVVLNRRKDKINRNINAFMRRGNNGLIIGFILFEIFVVYFSFDLYETYEILWLALLPIWFSVIFIFFILVSDAYKKKVKYQNRSSRMKLVGFNMDFNERVHRRIYGSLTQYEYLDENLTSFSDFYEVMVLDFDDHDSVLHFNCTQPQLKYILDKFKQLKKGISLKSFERSQKIYHKGNLISAEILSKKYNEFPPDHEFERRIDSFFDFLGDI
ncbi:MULTISPECIES: hypothetical protein [unclassified Arenibacter]|uniref:hypothetical protein n=1 Tax=unclassified Arenibacter TaxID=2615047 RepID=UPI000E348C96|nr:MULTISPECIES: hypothetical protein [unclassified Arenibacter]MCM4164562.1 hypothetical protein [Arenibacter sp. A80]RFT55646.1 hypothetical protein D0S24_13230 [Arenibacter sp. P308M17]